MALVAAGAAVLARLKQDPMAELASRVRELEQFTGKELANNAEGVKARFASIIDQSLTELSEISPEERKKLAEKGYALKDGSYPIRNVGDLKAAIHAYGRSKKGEHKDVRNHIMKRAKALKSEKLIPSKWLEMSTSETLTASAEAMRAKIAAAQEALGK